MTATLPARSRLRLGDLLSVGSVGLRTRKLRTALSALGVSIGIAAMVGVLGLSESSRSDLREQIAALGTDLLTIEPSGGFGGGDQAFPEGASGAVRRVGPVEQVADVIDVDAAVLRNDLVAASQTGGLSVAAVDTALLDTLNGSVAEGRWHDEATITVPTVVLGSIAAGRLGVDDAGDGRLVLIGDRWFSVIGVLDPFPLAEDLDRAALVGQPVAEAVFDIDDTPSAIHVRVEQRFLDDVRAVLPATVDPAEPEEVSVSRPTDVLEAQQAADSAFTSLFLGLGAVALLVGGIGIANVMVIAVIERRSEIGLRRALGATRAHIRRQFLTEALLLSALGGIAGVLVGVGVIGAYASTQDWAIVVPPEAVLGGLLAAVVIGAIAGLYPAARAARLAPTEALRTA